MHAGPERSDLPGVSPAFSENFPWPTCLDLSSHTVSSRGWSMTWRSWMPSPRTPPAWPGVHSVRLSRVVIGSSTSYAPTRASTRHFPPLTFSAERRSTRSRPSDSRRAFRQSATGGATAGAGVAGASGGAALGAAAAGAAVESAAAAASPTAASSTSMLSRLPKKQHGRYESLPFRWLCSLEIGGGRGLGGGRPVVPRSGRGDMWSGMATALPWLHRLHAWLAHSLLPSSQQRTCSTAASKVQRQ